MTFSDELAPPAFTVVPPTLLERAQSCRRWVFLRPGGPDLDTIRVESVEDPPAFALALVLDVPRRVTRAARAPLPTWLAVTAAVLLARR